MIEVAGGILLALAALIVLPLLLGNVGRILSFVAAGVVMIVVLATAFAG